jgi:hypothetical protein
MADVEITFPNKKKAKVASGTKMSDAAKKAGYKPNYACEEGKCGSCELKSGGKKVRVLLLCSSSLPFSLVISLSLSLSLCLSVSFDLSLSACIL